MALSLANARGERRASVEFARLRDLWFMWSVCNLECTHCYVGSSPRNRRLEALSLEEVRGFLAEGAGLGMEHVYFTGGEPFAARDIVPMLREAAALARVTVLTNGTGPIGRHLDALPELRERLTLRISLDHFDEERHDAVRGRGAFRGTLATIRRLCEQGFVPVVSVTPVVFEGTPVTFDEAVARFRGLFDGLPVEVKVLPTTLKMGAEVERTGVKGEAPFLAERQLKGADPMDFQCHYSRCVQKIDGRLRVYPCPIIYDDPDYDLGATLRDSMRRVYLGHHGCTSFCFKYRGKCGDEQLVPGKARGL